MKNKMKRVLGIILCLMLVMGGLPGTDIPVYADEAALHTHGGITFSAWESTDSLPTVPGNYYLTGLVTITSEWYVPEGETNLCLNGYGINQSGDNHCVAIISSGATLNLYDCGTDRVHRFSVNDDNLAVLDEENGTVQINGGFITGGNYDGSAHHGQGIVVDNGGTFRMKGGTIIGNGGRVKAGAGINNEGIVELSGNSQIIYNSTNDWGGGVCNRYGGATLTIKDNVVIMNNMGASGLHNNGGSVLHISGNPKIKDNMIVNNCCSGIWAEGTMYIDGALGENASVEVKSPSSNPTNNTLAYSYSGYAVTDADAAKFICENRGYTIVRQNDQLIYIDAWEVSFDTGGLAAVTGQKVLPSGRAIRPDDPTADGYTFNGWYTDGSFEDEFDFNTLITENTTIYAKWTENISRTVTFKVVNGSWNEGEGDAATADKVVTLTGRAGDTLKLAADQIPAVGGKPSDGYKAGSWNATPDTDTEIIDATTYIYTYAVKEAATVAAAPEAKTLTRNGQEQELVTGGEATGGEMQYAIGTDETTAPTSGWSASIPTAADTGTYYVWYKVVGDTDHADSEAACVTAKINAPAQVPIIVIPPVVTPEPTATPDPTATPEPTPVSDITGAPEDTAAEPSGGPTEAPGDAEPTSAPADDTATDTPGTSDPTEGEEDETPYKDVTIDEGFIRDITGTREATAESNPYETKIVNNSELKSLLRIADTEEDEGVNVWLDIQDISDTIPEEEEEQIAEASTDGYTVALFLDASLFMKVGDNAPEKITETNGKIKVSIVIPEELRADGRSYEIIRLHDGSATVLQGVYDPEDYTFTFETDRFSAYAVAYKEQTGGTADSGEDTASETLPQTGLRPVDVFYGLGLAWICYGAIVCLRDIWRRREEKG